MKVSVCIATYNGSAFIKEQIDSILSQITEEDEIIISDDKSTDNTIQIIRSINDNRIKIFINEERIGYTANFENAIKKSNGDYIFISDQDDVWENNKVKTCLELLDKGYEFIVHDAFIVDEFKNVIKDSFFKTANSKKTLIGNLLKFSYIGCCMCFSRKVLIKSIPFPRRRDLCTHDNWILLIGFFLFKHKICNEKLILYRRHNSNVSKGRIEKLSNPIIFMIKYRLYLIINLFYRISNKY